MPSSMTHCYFCEDVYKKCNKNIKSNLKNNINFFKVFGQGPDPYFFYDFHLTKKSKEIHKINDAMQHTNVNKHFISLINYINKKNYYYNSQVMSYLYGQICHFVLDSTVHPYIIYYTGIYKENKPSTFKYNGLHEEMEYYIDCYMIWQREKIMPKNFKIYKYLFNISDFNSELLTTIDDVTYVVYGFQNVGNIYYKSILDMKKFYHIFNYDKYGIKKIIYSLMDFICRDRCIRKKELSFNVNPNSKLYYLNNEKNTWNHPCDISEKYNLSFFEIYDLALIKAVNIINTVDDMLNRKKIDNNKLEKLFGNLHYGTGKDCNLKLTYKYFKF